MDRSHRRTVGWLVAPVIATLVAAGLAVVAARAQAQQGTIRGAAGNILAGVAVTPDLLNNTTYANLVRTHFSSLTAENHTKMRPCGCSVRWRGSRPAAAGQW
jgi:hypothetical protein